MERKRSNQDDKIEKEYDDDFQDRFYMLEVLKPHETINTSPREFGKELAAILMDRIDREVTKIE